MSKHTIIQVGNNVESVNSGDEVDVYGHIYIAQDHGDNLTLVYDRPATELVPKFKEGDLVIPNRGIFVCEVITINPDKTYKVRPKNGVMQFDVAEENLVPYEKKIKSDSATQKKEPLADFYVDDIVLAGDMKVVSKIVEIKPDGAHVITPEGLNMTFEVKKEDLILHKRKSPPLFKVDDEVFMQGFLCVVTEVHRNDLYSVRIIGVNGNNDIYTKKESELILYQRRAK